MPRGCASRLEGVSCTRRILSTCRKFILSSTLSKTSWRFSLLTAQSVEFSKSELDFYSHAYISRHQCTQHCDPHWDWEICVNFRAQEAENENMGAFCGATIEDQALSAMRNPLVHWSDFSIEFDAAFGIFIVCLIGLIIVLFVVGIECCLGVYKKVNLLKLQPVSFYMSCAFRLFCRKSKSQLCQ